jgi:hypothetical protein
MSKLIMSLDPTDHEILETVDAWVEALTRGDYDRALALINAEPQWNADLLCRVVTNYGHFDRPPGPHRVTSPAAAEGDPVREVDRFANGVVEAWYNLPLDGRWSDLTATISVERRAADSVLHLRDIRIR